MNTLNSFYSQLEETTKIADHAESEINVQQVGMTSISLAFQAMSITNEGCWE